jgi:hypothetical protein
MLTGGALDETSLEGSITGQIWKLALKNVQSEQTESERSDSQEEALWALSAVALLFFYCPKAIAG